MIVSVSLPDSPGVDHYAWLMLIQPVMLFGNSWLIPFIEQMPSLKFSLIHCSSYTSPFGFSFSEWL